MDFEIKLTKKQEKFLQKKVKEFKESEVTFHFAIFCQPITNESVIKCTFVDDKKSLKMIEAFNRINKEF